MLGNDFDVVCVSNEREDLMVDLRKEQRHATSSMLRYHAATGIIRVIPF